MNAFRQYGKQMAIYRKWYNFYRKRSAAVAYTIDSDKAIFICLHITQQDHLYSLPGGGIEKSETAEDAALRELV
jgi:8-oxo-dGTP pyrophosphatase MutT (NUDIX family)